MLTVAMAAHREDAGILRELYQWLAEPKPLTARSETGRLGIAGSSALVGLLRSRFLHAIFVI